MPVYYEIAKCENGCTVDQNMFKTKVNVLICIMLKLKFFLKKKKCLIAIDK